MEEVLLAGGRKLWQSDTGEWEKQESGARMRRREQRVESE